jgi:hypothetical protein
MLEVGEGVVGGYAVVGSRLEILLVRACITLEVEGRIELEVM